MRAVSQDRSITICLLTFGDYSHLVARALNSIRTNCPRPDYSIVVGANAVSARTDDLLKTALDRGEIDRVHFNSENIGKCGMMRQMFSGITTKFIWWFDDDAYITEATALERWLQATSESDDSVVVWGQEAVCEYTSAFTDMNDPVRWVRQAGWYRGLPPPSWEHGGKGEFNYLGKGFGDPRWFFILGGCFLVRRKAVEKINWPDPRLFILGDDVFFGEAIRQQGWNSANIGRPGVMVADEPSRGLRK